MKEKKAKVRRARYSDVFLEVCSNCGLHAHLLVDERALPEASSKEHLFAQMFNLIREGQLSPTRAKRIMREILAIPQMKDMDAEAEELMKPSSADRTLKAMFAVRDAAGQGSGLLTPASGQFHGDDFLGVDTIIRDY